MAWLKASVPGAAIAMFPATPPAVPPAPIASRPDDTVAPAASDAPDRVAVPPATVSRVATVPEANVAVAAVLTVALPESVPFRKSSRPPSSTTGPATVGVVEASPTCSVPAETVVSPVEELETRRVARPAPCLTNEGEPMIEPAPEKVKSMAVLSTTTEPGATSAASDTPLTTAESSNRT